MWFAGRNFSSSNWMIDAAYSPNGYDWYLSDRNPVLRVGTTGEFDEIWAIDPFVLKKGNTLFMYYTAYNGTDWHLMMARSLSGLVWQKEILVNPILSPVPGTWESVASNAGHVLQVEDSLIMLYTGYDGSTDRIGRATSRDGFAWTRDTTNPVLQPGPSGSWDAGGVFCMGFLKRDSLFYLFYGAVPKGPIGLAISSDSRSWTRYKGNPVFLPGGSGRWDEYIAPASFLLEGDTLRCWYTGENASGVHAIGYAKSPWTSPVLGVGSESLPEDFRVIQNYPNPFNPGTVIAYDLPARADVVVTVFNLLGQEIATLVRATQERGNHSVTWQPENLSTGTYLCHVRAGERVSTIKLMYLK
jgi:predicted GH43/DUF377 family glycosyl hydrolase